MHTFALAAQHPDGAVSRRDFFASPSPVKIPLMQTCEPAIPPFLETYPLGEAVTAFTTLRTGGVGQGSYASFNVTDYCGDDPAAVAQNRTALCRALHLPSDRFILPRQTHGVRVAHIAPAFLALDAAARREQLEGVDALITQEAEVCIGVSTADCLPLLLYDPEHRAAAAVHSGWRGTAARIAQCTVEAMARAFATRPERLLAVVGPGIGRDAFEVGDEVYAAFLEAHFPMVSIAARYPAAGCGAGRWHINLAAAVVHTLLQCGVSLEHVRASSQCTYTNPERYFSARRLGIHSGRIYTGIVLRA